MVATLPLEDVEAYMLLIFESGWSHPERGTKDVLKIRTSFLKNPRPPYCVLEKYILAVDLADTLNDEIRGIDLDLGA